MLAVPPVHVYGLRGSLRCRVRPSAAWPAGWSFQLTDVACTAISSTLPFLVKNLSMSIFRDGSLAVGSSRSLLRLCLAPCRFYGCICLARIPSGHL